MALMPRRKKKTGAPEWNWRRWIVILTILFCFWQLVGLRSAADTRVNETLGWGYIVLVAVLVLTYTGLATAQDIAAIFATRSALPYAPPTDGYGDPYASDAGVQRAGGGAAIETPRSGE